MSKRNLQDIKGVIPAMMTCFDEQGRFDESRQRDLTRFLLTKKVDGLYLTGSTGETFLMTGEERKRVVEVVLDEVGGRIPVIVHVGDIGTDKSIELARHAYECGADAISSVPPFYFKFSSDEIVGYYQDISESVPLPMIVYNIALAGLVDFSTIKRLAKIENVKGIKYTATSHHEILRIKEEIGKDFMVYSGCDEMAMSGMAYGSDGIIGSFYNVIPELFLQIVAAEKNNDIKQAKILQTSADAIIFFVLEHSFFASMKKMLAWAGHDAGYSRRPFAPLTAEDEVQLREGLLAIKDKYQISGVEVLDNL
ncbi:MAG: dihydrodipicolinate synthase family protein [Sphaerochaeta sp.]|nr:dihydrodipicolinate synthase family protein [Sphaerochaeta sp.]